MGVSVANAQTQTVEIDELRYELRDDSATVAGLKESEQVGERNLVIPASVVYDGKSYVVARIGYNAFAERSDIVSVELPTSVVEIGKNSFTSCENLKSVNIPENVRRIGFKAFEGCSGLTKINYEARDARYNEGNYGNACFSRLLESPSLQLTFSEKVRSIPTYLFRDSKISELTINNAEDVASNAFLYCTIDKLNLNAPRCNRRRSYSSDGCFEDCNIANVVIGNNCRVIGNYLFKGSNISGAITIPESVDSIGSGAFMYSGATINNLLLGGNGVKYVGDFAFMDATLETLEVPVDFDLEYGAFAKCGLKNLFLQDGIDSIGEQLFAYNPDLSVSIPESVEYIAEDAFKESVNYSYTATQSKIGLSVKHGFSGYKIRRVLLYSKKYDTSGNYLKDEEVVYRGTMVGDVTHFSDLPANDRFHMIVTLMDDKRRTLVISTFDNIITKPLLDVKLGVDCQNATPTKLDVVIDYAAELGDAKAVPKKVYFHPNNASHEWKSTCGDYCSYWVEKEFVVKDKRIVLSLQTKPGEKNSGKFYVQ